MVSRSTLQGPQNAQNPQNIPNPPSGRVLTPEILGNEIVTLYVGHKRKQFTIHKKLLCDQSSFFANAFNGSFREAQEGVMYLPEDDVDAVSSLVDFLYRETLPRRSDKSVESVSSVLFNFYILAEKLCMSDLMDRTIDEIFHFCYSKFVNFGGTYIANVYRNTNEKSKIRAFCVALLVCSISRKNKDDAWCERYTALATTAPKFFVDIFRFQAKHGRTLAECQMAPGTQTLAAVTSLCEFHNHEKDEDCYLKRAK